MILERLINNLNNCAKVFSHSSEQKVIVNSEYQNAAQECAYFVFESEWVQHGYDDHISSGENPKDHILYSAAVILDKTENFQDDINEYERSLNESQTS